MRRCIFGITLCMVCLLMAANGLNPLRLHVIANSNSVWDQQIKLEVRDRLLAGESEALAECGSKETARTYLEQKTAELEETIREVLHENGACYDVEIQIGTDIFPQKTYGNLVYPAGEYDAVRVVLGDGAGENWWCVMFPPLCLLQPAPTQDEPIVYTSFLLTWIKGLFAR